MLAPTLATAWLIAAVCLSAPATAQSASAPPPPSRPAAVHEAPSCLGELANAERRYGIPSGLLVAMALVESGRTDTATGMIAPWAWTLNAQGTGHFYETADEAARDAGKFLGQDNAFVDVGCMQVDLYHHPHAFPTLLAAFDPKTNVDYAARYLAGLRRAHGSWTAAVAAYHAGIPADGATYLARVLYYWKEKGISTAAASGRGFQAEEGPQPLDMAAAFFAKKDYASALAIYKAMLETKPDDPSALLGAAECFRLTGRASQARSLLERALTADPHDKASLDALLRLIDQSPQQQRLTWLTSARQVAPDAPQLSARIAMIEAANGQLPEAVADMGKAVRVAPGDPQLLLDYALLLDRYGKRSAAAQVYDAFLQAYRPGTVALAVPLQQIKDRRDFLERQKD